MASLLWSQHVCEGWQLTLLWQEPSWCQRGLSAQLPPCASAQCHHTLLTHTGPQAVLLLPGYPQLSWASPVGVVPLLREAFNRTMEVAQDSGCVKTPQGELSESHGCSVLTSSSGGFIQSSLVFNTTYSSDTHTLFSVFQVDLNTYVHRIYRMGVRGFLSDRMQQIKSRVLHLSVILI